MDIAAHKAQARAAVRERIEHLKPQERDAESRSICRRILENLDDAPLHICVYNALPFEASLAMLLPALWERGDTVYMPRFAANRLHFGEVQEDSTLLKGSLGIFEPSVDAKLPDLEGIDLVLVPGLAFDRERRRLGRGNGGYDRWLAELRTANANVKIWGVALACQMLRDVPHETHDQLMDGVVTARELL